jgi:prepilin-type processing-associated H-X9-DG protein
MVRDTFYCPSGDMQNADGLWNWPNGYAVAGYFWLMQRLAPYPGPVLINGAQYERKISATNSGHLEIATDATLSNNGNFANCPGGWIVPFRSNHLNARVGTLGTGGNILFLDGHASWRSLNEMQIRAQLLWRVARIGQRIRMAQGKLVFRILALTAAGGAQEAE